MPSKRQPHEELIKAMEELAASKAQLERALIAEQDRARRDPLTGVLNHGAIVDELEKLICRRRETAVVLVDLDDLKAINDTYGHQAGDAVLVTVAHSLQLDDAIVGRYGGDEFLVLVPGAGRHAAENYCKWVVGELGRAHLQEFGLDATVPISASLGVAVFPEEAHTMGDLIRLSDSAMYAQKQRRANQSDPNRPEGNGRVAKLLSDILPLLTAPGTRDDKLRLVAHRLCVGVGYDAVNFEVAGAPTRTSTTWQRSFARAPEDVLKAWADVQEQTQGHTLSNALDRTRQPIFINDISIDEHLTPDERKLLSGAGLRSGVVVPMVWQDKLVGMLSAASKELATFTSWDAQFLTAVSSQVTAIVFMTTLVEELQLASTDLELARAETVMMLAATAEAHDMTTGHHLQGVRSVSELLALELGFDPLDAKEIGLASVLHDIGKIRVPEAVLGSTGKLSEVEWELMKHHTLWGREFLANHPGFELMASIALHHHERWDGSGYPGGVAGDNIPIEATIVSVADSYDAITNDRPYRRKRSIAKAVAEISAYAGTQFNPAVVEALQRLHERGALPRARRSHHLAKAA